MRRRLFPSALAPMAVSVVVVSLLGSASVAAPSAAAASWAPSVSCSEPPSHTIAQVQGPGATSPIPPDTPVSVEGVVTADHRVGGFAGVYIQSIGSGAGRRVAAGVPSDGLFVGLGAVPGAGPLAIGERLRVAGTVAERGGLTELVVATATDLASCGTAPSPAPVPLALPASDAERESVEGMAVRPVGPFTVSDVAGLDRYGEAVLRAGAEPAVVPTDAYRPRSAAAIALAARNAARRLVLDDARSARLSNRVEPPYESKTNPVRVGDRVARFGPTVLSFAFGDWRLQPTTPVDASTPAAARTTFTRTNPRVPTPDRVGGDLRLAGLNVHNYFVHFGGLARGAADPAALALQQAKIVSAVRGLQADVVALSEVENSVRFSPDQPQLALQQLVGALDAADPAHPWDYVRTPSGLRPPERQDVITTAIIFRPAAVTPVGPSVTGDDERVWSNARPPLAQTFRRGAATFTVVANHLKSKSAGVPPTGDNADAGDGQGPYNGDRTRQAGSLAQFVDRLKASSGSSDVALLGDFNAYGHEDPIQVLAGHGLIDVEQARGHGEHSYVFGGESGSLDHVLVTPSLLSKVTGIDIWNVNAEESAAFDYAGYPPYYDRGPFRSSDHDPVVVGLRTSSRPLPPMPPAPPARPSPVPIELQVLAINDLHGRLEAPASLPPPDRRPIGGMGQVAGLVGQLRLANPNTVFVSAGDNIGASTFVSAVDGDTPTIDALNASGLAVSALGNHELDRGFADLEGRVVPRARFPYLAANVYKDGRRALPALRIQRIGGVRVATIGVVTEETRSLVNPAGIAGLEIRDPVAEADAVAAQLKDGNPANGEADVVLLLAHEGAAPDHTGSPGALAADPTFGPFVRSSPAIDAVISGHTHQAYAFEVPLAARVPLATAPDDWSRGLRPVVQALDYGVKLGCITLTFDPVAHRVVRSRAELLDVVGAPVDARVQAIVDAAEAKAAVLGLRPVGSITADILRGRPGAPEDRGVESVLGNFIADVQLAATRDTGRGGAQLALTNAGGLRADLRRGPKGVVRYADAFAVQPFANDVVTKTFTGAQLADALEQQWQPAGTGQRVLWLGVSKGVTYSYEPAAPLGHHVRRATLRLDGRPVDPAGSYRVTSNSFLAAGGDHFTALAAGTDRSTTGDNDLTMLVAYLAAHSPVTPDPTPRTTPVS
ncbi:MAG: putative 5-nucleotidase [Acidimicrobiales bacterium]|nr:putative 5-nucleotidase [Acidimicrobiales bacterium]